LNAVSPRPGMPDRCLGYATVLAPRCFDKLRGCESFVLATDVLAALPQGAHLGLLHSHLILGQAGLGRASWPLLGGLNAQPAQEIMGYRY